MSQTIVFTKKRETLHGDADSKISLAVSGDPKDSILQVPEILAPAGGRAAFFAALQTGADAVFLGLDSFNARSRAENFTIADLKDLVPLAHFYEMKVLVTLNILIKEMEFSKLIGLIWELERLGVHAVIVQDLGVLHVVRTYFPSLRIHASTQMAVHNVWGVVQAAKLGIRRVVVARELTLTEISKIVREANKLAVEIEMFCHGSLCYSYSGLCFFSGAQDARSGNRGECAYTCRVPYKIISEPGEGFLFSMKDLNTGHVLEKLVATGVHTLKIEGRKKDAQYVATTVQLYRQKLNQIFGRSTERASVKPLLEAHKSVLDGMDSEVSKFTFQRDCTTFFLQGRYKENVIDLASPTHKGVLAGTVEQSADRCISFVTQTPLSLHDGIRIDPPESLVKIEESPRDIAAKTFGNAARKRDLPKSHAKYNNLVNRFGVKSLYVNKRSVVSAPPGQRVTLKLETDLEVEVGSLIFKERSDALRSAVSALSKDVHFKGFDYSLGLNFTIEESATSQDSEIKLVCDVTLLNKFIFSHKFAVAIVKAENQDAIKNAFSKTFDVFGVLSAKVANVNFQKEFCEYFVPLKTIKEWKRQLEADLKPVLTSLKDKQIRGISESLNPQASGLQKVHRSKWKDLKKKLIVKTDQLDVFEALKSYEFPQDVVLKEVIFEPKRNQKGSLQESMVADAFAFCLQKGVFFSLSLPTVLRAWDEPFIRNQCNRHIEKHAQEDTWGWQVGNIGGFSFLRSLDPKFDTRKKSADFSLFSLNSYAVQELCLNGISQCTLNFEDDFTNMSESLSRWNLQVFGATPVVIVYKDIPLFIAESCTLTALHQGCPGNEVCGYRTLEIENPEGERFFVGHENCKSIVYGNKPFSLLGYGDELAPTKVDHFRLDFLTRPYDTKTVHSVLESFCRDEKRDETHTSNFLRTLL